MKFANTSGSNYHLHNYQLTMFQYVNEIQNKDLICSYCQQVVIFPVYCHDCDILFCNQCFGSDKVNTCCDKITRGVEPPIDGEGYISSILGKLEIFCPINRENGCQWRGMRKDNLIHVEECSKRYRPCAFGCGKRVLEDDLTHSRDCQNYGVINSNSQNIPQQLYTSHSYLKQLVTDLKEEKERLSDQLEEYQRENLKYREEHDKIVMEFQKKNQKLRRDLDRLSKNVKEVIVLESPKRISLVDYYLQNKEMIDIDILAQKEYHTLCILNLELPEKKALWDISIMCNSIFASIYDQNNVGNRNDKKFIKKISNGKKELFSYMAEYLVGGIIVPKYNNDGRYSMDDLYEIKQMINRQTINRQSFSLIHSVSEEDFTLQRSFRIVFDVHRSYLSFNIPQIKILAEKKKLGILTEEEKAEITLKYEFDIGTNFIVAREI